MTSELLLLSASTLISEDLACIAAGALVASGELSFTAASVACFAGIAAGDLGIFYSGRLLSVPLKPWLTQSALQRASAWLAGNTAKAVFASRFVPGTRTCTYFAAGALHAPARGFTIWFVIAGAVWTPLLVGSAALLGKQITASIFSLQGAAIGAGLFAAIRLLPKLASWENRRLLLGWILRKARWEFWPSWAAYVPLAPAMLWLSVKHRSLTVFTSANPAIPTGGLLEESKSAILQALRHSKAVAPWIAIDPGQQPETNREYPVVCKPDIGERGRGVVIARTPEALLETVSKATEKTIVQDYVAGNEFGIFYYRYPHQKRGRIFSITAKRFPAVTGDGRRTLKQLILADPRAVAISSVCIKNRPDAATTIPPSGESVQLVEIGAHCGGTIFLDGAHLNTEALENRVDQIARTFKKFYFGRFDVRAPSAEALQRGEFRILELNGVAAEATHIYDPKISIFDAYRTLYRQWRIAYEIGAENRSLGHKPTPLRNLLRLIAERLNLTGSR